jgi:hypothetical protein
MTDYKKILREQETKLAKALSHLNYTYKKIQKLSDDCKQLDEDELETWESFASRFGRASDIFLMRYLRTRVLIEDPGFVGTLRDFLKKAEKMNLIDDAEKWLAIRELRNLAAHEYVEEGLTRFYRQLKEHASELLAVANIFDNLKK